MCLKKREISVNLERWARSILEKCLLASVIHPSTHGIEMNDLKNIRFVISQSELEIKGYFSSSKFAFKISQVYHLFRDDFDSVFFQEKDIMSTGFVQSRFSIF